jgi:hypothetical protein
MPSICFAPMEGHMHAQNLLTPLNDGLARAGLAYRARFVPANDESVDDELVLDLAGGPTTLSLQVGYGSIALNEAIFNNGRIAAVANHLFWDVPVLPALISDTVKFLRGRG